MAALLDQRLVVVTGKGGTGKSTVAGALGLVAARRGLRTIVAEVAAQDRTARAFGRDTPSFEETEVAPGLFAISIEPEAALREYLREKAGRLADVLAASRTFSHFAAATPGMRELVSMGKVWELAQLRRRTRGAARYDLVILDAPATGHGLGFLRTPRTFADVSRVGPIAAQAQQIQANLSDPEFTGVITVARPEEMPVVETLELAAALESELGLELSRVVVNGLSPERYSSRERTLLRRASPDALSGAGRAAVRTALSDSERSRRERALVRRLARGTGRAPATLAQLSAETLGAAELALLADELGSQL
ncbi:MAG: hypothetical protein QOK31_1792 [Solirubrobacteraceae bacterium]|nr:hypothetical protein [Solirubrobacteraceae bacterium]